MSQEIIYIADPQILSVPIIECGEELIDVKYQKELAYGPPPECEFTKECYTKMRKTVFEKLCLAQKDLPNGWKFRLYEGFRSLKVQQLLFNEEYQRVVHRFPNLNNEQHFRETTRLISPVKNFDGSDNIPPHSTGAAVDIEIISLENKIIDMGMEIKEWIHVNPDLCLTHSKNTNENQQKNRQMLLDIMNAHDFINYPTEWWHFSYGDRYWAYHQESEFKKAMYGPVSINFF